MILFSGRRRYHACHFAAKDTNGQEQEGAHDKCLCSVIFHESLFEDKAQPRRRTVHSRSANSQNLLVGKDCRVSQQNQAKTASNGHGQTYPPKNDVTKEGKASKSTVSNFVSLVVEKLFDNKEPSDQNSALERGSPSAGIQSKLRCLRPAQTHREDVHSKSFLTFVSSKMFRLNENTFCATTGDYEKESHKATDLKPGKPCTSTCDVTTRFAERTSLNRDCSYCACTSRDNEDEGESFAAKVKPSTRERTSAGVGPRLLARLLETLSSSDTESDSSSSSDCLVSDSSVSDECEMPSVCGVPCSKKAFRHTTLCCQEFGVSSSSTDEFNPACNGSGDSTVQGSSFQRYYHVFHQGELVELIQGVPSVDVIEETYDHANWAVVAVKS